MNPIHACIMLVLGTFFLSIILRAIYRGRLRIAYSLIWLAIALVVLCTPILYDVFTWLHESAGWPTATSMIFLLGIFLVLLLLFHLTIILSTLWRRQVRIAREQTLLKDALLRHTLTSKDQFHE